MNQLIFSFHFILYFIYSPPITWTSNNGTRFWNPQMSLSKRSLHYDKKSPKQEMVKGPKLGKMIDIYSDKQNRVSGFQCEVTA